MPEITVYKHNYFFIGEDYIRFAWKVFNVLSKAITSFVQFGTYDLLNICVLVFNSGHAIARWEGESVSDIYSLFLSVNIIMANIT